MWREVGMLAKPVRLSASIRKSPEPPIPSPVKTRPGAIGAVRGGCEADEQQTSRRIAETRYRTTPVGVVAIRSTLVAGDLLTMRPKARAALASDNRVVNGGETGPLGEKSGRNGFHQICCGS